jgi:pseudo-rSAM protein
MGRIINFPSSQEVIPYIKPQIQVSELFKKYLSDKKIYYGGDFTKRQLRELTIYIDNLTYYFDDVHESASKQFDFLLKVSTYKKFSFRLLEKIKVELLNGNWSNLKKINIICRSLSDKIKLETFVAFIDKQNIKCDIYILFNHFREDKNLLLNKIYKTINIKIIIYKNYNVSISTLLNSSGRDKITLIFLVKNENDLSNIQKHERILSNIKYYMHPFFYRNNDFLKRYVFIDRNSLAGKTYHYQNILRNEILNIFFYGKLIVDMDGSLFSNMNANSIGNIFNDDVKEIVYREINCPETWKLLRKDLHPCNKCNYSNICPPISYLEQEIGQYNLCTINKLDKQP